MDNLEETDEFLEIYNLPRLNQEKVQNMNRPITSNKIESVIKKTPNKQKDRKKGSVPEDTWISFYTFATQSVVHEITWDLVTDMESQVQPSPVESEGPFKGSPGDLDALCSLKSTVLADLIGSL